MKEIVLQDSVEVHFNGEVKNVTRFAELDTLNNEVKVTLLVGFRKQISNTYTRQQYETEIKSARVYIDKVEDFPLEEPIPVEDIVKTQITRRKGAKNGKF